MSTLWLPSFLATLVIEVPIFILFVRKTVPLRRSSAAAAAGTCLTHPFLWFVWPLVVFENYALFFFSGEAIVAAVESVTFHLLARPPHWSRSVAASFTANTASAAGGVLLFKLLGLW